MADLLDIVPSTSVEVVHIANNQRLKVRGLQGPEIAAIAARFPNLIAVLAATGDNVVMLVSSVGLAVGSIIAAGCGHHDNEKAEAIAVALLVEDQIRLVKAILGLTFPNGLVPVMELLAAAVAGDAPDKPVKVRLKKSPSTSPPSSGADSRPIMQ
jgi:hypothetical protein